MTKSEEKAWMGLLCVALLCAAIGFLKANTKTNDNIYIAKTGGARGLIIETDNRRLEKIHGAYTAIFREYGFRNSVGGFPGAEPGNYVGRGRVAADEDEG